MGLSWPHLSIASGPLIMLRCETNKMSTNDLLNHMKDIDKVKDIQPLSFNQVQVCILYTQWTGSRTQNTPSTAPPCSSRRPILQEILTEAHRKSTNTANSTAQPGQHQKAKNDVDDIPPCHHSHTTHFLRGWSKSTSTQSTTLHTLTDCACHSTRVLHLINQT